jgi:hypothetical protein
MGTGIFAVGKTGGNPKFEPSIAGYKWLAET